VIIVDLDALSTSAAVSRFQLAHPDSKIVAFCAQPSVTQIRLSIRAGVCGLIDQSSSPARIVEVVAAAARGDWVLDRRSLASLISALDGFNATEREREVLELVERGLGDKQIAALLSISPKTVEKHVHSLLQKSGALNRTMLVRMRSEAPLPL
jgi:DNA-binding NarL/FixJ family response regulator